jgi:hypothetical protein
MKRTTCISENNWFYNEPISSESFPDISILPERFRSISEPTEIPIISKDLNTITEPVLYIAEESIL